MTFKVIISPNWSGHTKISKHTKVKERKVAKVPHSPVNPVNGWCITPMIGLPFTATQTIVVTYFTRFSVKETDIRIKRESRVGRIGCKIQKRQSEINDIRIQKG